MTCVAGSSKEQFKAPLKGGLAFNPILLLSLTPLKKSKLQRKIEQIALLINLIVVR